MRKPVKPARRVGVASRVKKGDGHGNSKDSWPDLHRSDNRRTTTQLLRDAYEVRRKVPWIYPYWRWYYWSERACKFRELSMR
jgi:hypothetical protein